MPQNRGAIVNPLANSLIDATQDPLLVLNADLSVHAANHRFYAAFNTDPERTIGCNVHRLSADGLWNGSDLRALLEKAATGDRDDPSVVHRDVLEIGPKTIQFQANWFSENPVGPRYLLLTATDVTDRLRTENELALQHKLLEITLRSIGDAVIATDSNSRVTLMNVTAERLTGWSEAEAKGRLLLEIFRIVNETTRRSVESPVDKALREGAIVGLANHTVLIARDGVERPIDDSAAPIRDADGNIAGVVMVFHDITDRREVEHRIETSEVRFRRLFEAARDGILLMDPTARTITDANPFMEELLEMDRSELIGKELWEIGLIADAQESRDTVQRLLDTGYVRFEDLPLESRRGRLRDVEFVSNVYAEGKKQVVQCNIRDITERKQLTAQREEALIAAKTAQSECEAANRAKDVFLATLSHELRSPLNAILGWSVMLRTEGHHDSTAVAEGLAVIERNARLQAKLIEDVLDLARIVSGKFTIDAQPCELTALTFATVEGVRATAAAKKISIDLRGDAKGNVGNVWVLGDSARLQQVLWNLLTNAVKFTPSGGRVVLRLDKREATAHLTVTDTGKGIAAAFLPYVFDRFRQADDGTTRVYGGLGLGLSIVRQIVELHGGTIVAESEGEGRGATFTLNLPLQKGEALATPVTLLAASPKLHNLRALLIDDERDARAMASAALESVGATVVLASSAEEGFCLVTQADPPFDVLVCDIGMPVEDGYSLARRLRSGGFNAKVLPAVALTAFAAPHDKRRALLAGFQVHVSKPVDPHDLIAVVASLTGRTGDQHMVEC